jgi:hypothetical protein
MTPEQLKTLTDSLDHLDGLLWIVLIVQGILALSLVLAHARIAKNQVITADLLRQAVAQIENDLPPGNGKK